MNTRHARVAGHEIYGLKMIDDPEANGTLYIKDRQSNQLIVYRVENGITTELIGIYDDCSVPGQMPWDGKQDEEAYQMTFEEVFT